MLKRRTKKSRVFGLCSSKSAVQAHCNTVRLISQSKLAEIVRYIPAPQVQLATPCHFLMVISKAIARQNGSYAEDERQLLCKSAIGVFKFPDSLFEVTFVFRRASF